MILGKHRCAGLQQLVLLTLILFFLLVHNVIILTGFSSQDFLLGLRVLKFLNAVSRVDVTALFHLHRASQPESLNPSSVMGCIFQPHLWYPWTTHFGFFPP